MIVGFEALQKAFQKAKSVVEKEGSTPVFYIRTLTQLEDFVLGVGWLYTVVLRFLNKVMLFL